MNETTEPAAWKRRVLEAFEESEHQATLHYKREAEVARLAFQHDLERLGIEIVPIGLAVEVDGVKFGVGEGHENEGYIVVALPCKNECCENWPIVTDIERSELLRDGGRREGQVILGKALSEGRKFCLECTRAGGRL